ncbi:hypothetical protein HK096_004860 [Nowakowskiella sp. JEL0078]|nr:hypothetical protein HK096_004860 [Nowakowskiella sp. JEL0078]
MVFLAKSQGYFVSNSQKWPEYSLRKQLLLVGITTTLLSLLIVESLSLGFLGVIISNISSTANDVLTSQLQDIITTSVENSAALFEFDLENTALSVALLIRRAAGDTFRSDQPLADVVSFFDSPDGVKAAGSTVPPAGSRYANKTISLEHSTYLTANYLGLTSPVLTTSEKTTVDLTAHLDILFRNAFKLSTNLITLYCGFENGIFRSFPGQGTSRISGEYDPRVRPWYLDAMNNLNSKYVVTDPYLSAFGKGWMYTISSIITNSTSGTIIGVAGIDVLIGTLKSELDAISVPNGSNSIYLTNGNALSSPSWNLASWPKNSTFTFRDAENPSITDDLWKSILTTNSTPGVAVVLNNYIDPKTSEKYLLVYMSLNMTNGKSTPSYIGISAFPLAKVTEPVKAVQATMTRLLGTFSGISVGIFIAVVAIVGTSVTALANAASKPLVKLSEESAKISNNIGNSDLLEGVTKSSSLPRRGYLKVDETEDLTKRFYTMINRLREHSVAPELSSGNIFFGDRNLPSWNASTQPSGVVNEVPDLPPPYDLGEEERLLQAPPAVHIRTANSVAALPRTSSQFASLQQSSSTNL